VSLPGTGPGSGPGAGAGPGPAGPPAGPGAASSTGAGGAAGAAAIAAPSVLNVANGLTVLRLALVPVFVALLVQPGAGWRIAAFVAFWVASLTDLLDGELARRRGLITDFGKIADPIADKALTGSALVTLSLLGEVPWWVTAVILFRELAVTGLRFWVIRRGVIAASRGGKAKTILQLVAISLYILPGPPDWLRAVVMAAAVALTLVTGIDYAMRAMRLRRAVPAPARQDRPDSPPGERP
jgi:CDP-diacylglycerol---glycerol-3-phosphate 3-phosphatidyltransferase